ncbi:CBN-CLEC-40 protein [Caenorhabditis brenneri]|uniref:CBN-CLEC-40 protein n=1 Tax=Caenorhabditis brenneri TaxID=135651 RepID=G0N325_CAEBE|nr:CBN-CLEC-40 protein [Caenorhabditis brenneri]
MFNRISQIYQARQDRLSRQFENQESLASNRNSQHSEEIQSASLENAAATSTEGTQDAEPKTEFEPVERQRHFGILHYTMNNRFKKIMLIGLANLLIILAFFLFMFFFMMRFRCGTLDISTTTTIAPTTTYTTRAPSSTNAPQLKTCMNGFQLVGSKCWWINVRVYNRDTAVETCRTYGSILFTIDNEAEDLAWKAFMNNQHHRCWMGLLCKNSNKETCEWDNSVKWPFAYSAFAEDSPSDTLPCIYYNVSDSLGAPWTSSDCSLNLSSVCELPPTGESDCLYNYKGFCYYYYATPVTFSEAQDACKTKCGNLASVGSHLEYIFLSSIEGVQDISIYLGGVVVNQNLFYWLDGSPTNYNNIQKYDEKSSCLVLNMGQKANNGNWSTVPCTSKNPYVCKVPNDVICN